MADQQRDHNRQPGQHIQVHPTWGFDAITKSRTPQKGHSISQVLTVIVLLSVGFTLLALAGIALTGTIIGLCVVTPLFVLFSPVLVPAAITIGLAMVGLFTSGAFGLTALSSFSWSFSWVLNSLRQATGTMSETADGQVMSEIADQLKRRMEELVAQKTEEVAQEIQSKAQVKREMEDQQKRRMAELEGQKSEEAGQEIQSNADEAGKTDITEQ